MRFLLTAILAASFSSIASAGDLMPGNFEAGTLYNMHVSDWVNVGNGLVSITISIENISGNPDFDVNSITNAQFGEASGLHHDFGAGGFVPTPLGRTSNDIFGLPSSTVDSHFLPDGQGASPIISAPTESGPLINVGAPTQLTSGKTGLGSGISGQFGFPSAQTVNIARLVVPYSTLDIASGGGVDFGFSVADASVDSQGERFVGHVIIGPEPTSTVLFMLGLVGVVACRRRVD